MYCPQLSFRADAPIDERLRVFKKIRAILEETDGRVVTSTECELDGQYHPTVEETFFSRLRVAGVSRPWSCREITVRLRSGAASDFW